MSATFQATAQIKLVIWDMDDTFWGGTLSEGDIALNQANIDIVKALVDRGIMSSIVSKNDLEPVKQVLTDAGIWDLFIFPKISWTAKGNQIAELLEDAGLRPDNALFVDDNSINIEEARFRFPTMMVAYPEEVLPQLLALPECKGKDDINHSRLKQYKQLEKKVVDRSCSALSNVEFLRQCDIKLRFVYDIENHMERIVELVNRSNQLNFTKKRIETAEARAEFEAQLTRHDIFVAGISARDRYGSHGLIGFYMQHRNERENRLIHYVWSCRMMNAGLEQYVYERLGCPQIDVVEPVSNPICDFEAVDWISETQSDDDENEAPSPNLVLIGSCDLTAVASYCSSNRAEFVNGVKHGIMTRYDDFGFILGDNDRIAASRTLPVMPAWDAKDHAAFQDSLPESEVMIVSLSAAMKGAYCVTPDDVVIRVHPEGLGHYIDFNPRAQFLEGCEFYALDADQKTELLKQALASLSDASQAGCQKFLLGANTRIVDGAPSETELALLESYNSICRAYCERHADWQFVDINEVVPESELLDDRHYSRVGYLQIANHINARLSAGAAPAAMAATERHTEAIDLVAFVRSGRKLSRFETFGRPSSGFADQLKQAVKMTPISSMVRKILGKPMVPAEMAKN